MTDVDAEWTERELAFSRALHRAVDGAVPAEPPPTAARPVTAPVDLGRRRRWALAAVPVLAACVVAALVVGIGFATRDEPAPAASTPADGVNPDVLLGEWSTVVVGSIGFDRLHVTVTPSAFVVEHEGCDHSLSWAAHPDGLLRLDTLDPGCVDQDAVNRLRGTAGFVVDGEDVVLVDVAGARVARLRQVGDGPRPGAGARPDVAPLPAGVRAPTLGDLQGTWTEGDVSGAREVEVLGSTWSVPVGCNRSTQQFGLSDRGGIVFNPFAVVTQIGCPDDGDDAADLGPARLGLDGPTLVLYDADGREISRMRRATGPVSLPDDALPVGPGAIQGRWSGTGDDAGQSAVVDGAWLALGNGSCPAQQVEQALGPDGWVASTRTVTRTYALRGGCVSGLPDLSISGIARVAIDGDELLVVDLAGAVVARFGRAAP